VTGFVKITGDNYVLPENIKIACIGPVTAATAEKAGLHVDIQQQEYTISGLVKALIDYCGE